MSDRRDLLSQAAVRLLVAHRPGEPAYQSWALGIPDSPDALGPIDAAYEELVSRGLMVPAGLPVPVLPGVIRDAFILTCPPELVVANSSPARIEARQALRPWFGGRDQDADIPDIIPRNDTPQTEAEESPASVDLPAILRDSPSAPGLFEQPTFGRAVRIGIGLGVGFWLTGAIVFLVVWAVLFAFGWLTGGPANTVGAVR